MTIGVRRVINSHDFDTRGICRDCKHSRREVSLELILCSERRGRPGPDDDLIIRPYAGGFGAYGASRLTDVGYLKSGQPQVRFTAEPWLRQKLLEIAEAEDVSLSEIIRRACRAYVGRRR